VRCHALDQELLAEGGVAVTLVEAAVVLVGLGELVVISAAAPVVSLVGPLRTRWTGTYPYPYAGSPPYGEDRMSDANIRIPAEARDRLARIASSEGMSLRGYLSHLAESLLTPEERTARSEQARAALREWSGYDPSTSEQAALDAELERRLSEARAK
jgi:hypothetical protein